MEASERLLQLAMRFAERQCNPNGVASTPVSGLVVLRETRPTPLQYAISKPLVALVLQGRKRVSMGEMNLDFGAGQSLLIAADVPTISQITQATFSAPYLSLVVELDANVIAEVVRSVGAPPYVVERPVQVDATDREVEETACRLLQLLDRPGSLAILGHQLVRELHYWLIVGRHGHAIRALGVPDSAAERIARAITVIRENYAKALRMDELARFAGMSISAFFSHFRVVTSLSPLQFQKQLRLIEARRRLLAEGVTVSAAAFDVGYESVPQFTREYGRLFGVTPARDLRESRTREAIVA